MDQKEHDALGDVERKAYDRGLIDGMAQTDAKLAECLAGIKRGNELHVRLKQERDAVLEEYARVSWGKVCQGMANVGMHPPSLHKLPQYQRRLGVTPCKKCSDELVTWDELAADVKKSKMLKVWGAIVQVRARRAVDAGVSALNPDAPTTTDLSGAATPIDA